MHDIICESKGPKGSVGSFGREFGRELEELAREIEGGKRPHDPDANFWGLTDPYVDQAKEWIKYLLHVDAEKSGVDEPEVYGPEILACAIAVKKLISKINLNIAMRKRERIPLVIKELGETIEALRAAGVETP